MFNPAKWSHKEKFIRSVEEQLEIYNIKEELEWMKISATHHQIEYIDKIIIRIFNIAIKKLRE